MTNDSIESDDKSKVSKIRNKISMARPNFSLAIETDENLQKARRVFEELMEKYKR